MGKKIESPQDLYEEKKSKYIKVARALVESLDDYILSSGKRNKDERLVASSLILDSVFDLVSFASFPIPGGIKKDAFGKPSLCESDIKISIAHNEDYVVVAYARDIEIGVDIEGEIDEEKAEKLSLRFFGISSLNIEKKSSEMAEGNMKIYLFKMLDDGRFEPVSLAVADDSFTAKWTAAEALMKCDGRGFSALCEIERLKKRMNICSFCLQFNDNKTYISIAEE